MPQLDEAGLRLTVDLHGGRVIDSQLLQYTEEKKPGSPNIRLLTSDPAKYYVADAGLITVDAQNAQHEMQAQFRTANGTRAAELAPGATDVALPMEWTDPASGLTVRRTLSMKRGSYVLQVTDQVSNAGSIAQRVYPFVRLSRVAPPPPPKHSFMTNPESLSFIGAAWHSPDENYEKSKWTDFGVKQPSSTADVAGVWFAMLQHHFVTAWVPMPEEKQILRTSVASLGGQPLYELRSIATPLQIGPAASATHQSRVWVGP